ncbi:serine hydrolase domain-containing protein [Microbacterium sp. ASV49]|uniref:Serine hydrolase domain-containing protein n=1 Tax=Microbacterium candidum TaxID=3041922 RepID=A0ABT7N2S0_9MICO|nr:serine hydrolase domain-containing protein [Microbacterium sp. ASV49]MDL9980968.1 serine hydrolase domain-containing protein [Microbacterium sp. ASV49]
MSEDIVLDELQRLLDAAVREMNVPGVAIGIVDGDSDHVLTAGVASTVTGAPVTADTLFAIGSTSKTVTATAAMHLIEEGAFDLDTRVVDLLPELRLSDPEAQEKLLVRHLLTHSGGFLGDIDDDPQDWGADALARSIAGFRELPQLFAPGSIASYSNAGLRLLGHLTSVVAGRPFEDLIAGTVLNPLGMTDSVYFPWEGIVRPVAVGHTVADGMPKPAPVWGLARDMAPEGGLLSSVRDQLRYARFHLRGEAQGPAPIGDETRRMMQRAHIEVGPPLEAIGLPWLLTHVGDARVVRHGGNISNLQLSEMVLLPDHDLAVTVLMNGASPLGPQLVSWCLENLRGIHPAPAEDAVPHPSPEEVVGSYDVNLWQNVVTLEGGDIVVTPELRQDLVDQGFPPLPTVRARLGADLLLRDADGHALGRFLTAADGTEFLHIGLRAAPRI